MCIPKFLLPQLKNNIVKASLHVLPSLGKNCPTIGSGGDPFTRRAGRKYLTDGYKGILGFWYWSSVPLLSRSRFLRNRDRDVHYHMYPKLFYPELYLIEGGYKAFFGKCKVRDILGVKSELSKFCSSAGIWLFARFPSELQNCALLTCRSCSIDHSRILGIGLELACKWG